MSGKQQSKTEGTQRSSLARSSYPNDHSPNGLYHSDLTIPAVMITKSDAEGMMRVMEANSRINERSTLHPINARIDLVSSLSMLDSTFMGSSLYPKLIVGHLVAHVICSEEWGVVLNSSNGQEWQLFIMSADDVEASMATSPWFAVTPGHLPVSTYFTGAASALNLYRGTITRQCPTHIDLDGGQVLIRNQ